MSGGHWSEPAGDRDPLGPNVRPFERPGIQPDPELEASGDFVGVVIWAVVRAMMAGGDVARREGN